MGKFGLMDGLAASEPAKYVENSYIFSWLNVLVYPTNYLTDCQWLVDGPAARCQLSGDDDRSQMLFRRTNMHAEHRSALGVKHFPFTVVFDHLLY